MRYFWMATTGAVAFMNGRGVIRWVLGAYFFSFFAPLVLLFLPIKPLKVEQRQLMIRPFAVRHVAKQEVKDVNTVDDLFKQLETK